MATGTLPAWQIISRANTGGLVQESLLQSCSSNQETVMTAYLARLKPDWLRQLIWIAYFPAVYLDLWIEFRRSPRLRELTTAAFLLGWRGLK